MSSTVYSSFISIMPRDPRRGPRHRDPLYCAIDPCCSVPLGHDVLTVGLSLRNHQRYPVLSAWICIGRYKQATAENIPNAMPMADGQCNPHGETGYRLQIHTPSRNRRDRFLTPRRVALPDPDCADSNPCQPTTPKRTRVHAPPMQDSGPSNTNHFKRAKFCRSPYYVTSTGKNDSSLGEIYQPEAGAANDQELGTRAAIAVLGQFGSPCSEVETFPSGECTDYLFSHHCFVL